jgi:hypothetical protein
MYKYLSIREARRDGLEVNVTSNFHLRFVVPKALRRVMRTPLEYDIYSIGEARRDGPPTLYHPSGMSTDIRILVGEIRVSTSSWRAPGPPA